MLTEKQYRIRLDTFNLVKGILMIMIVLAHKLPHYSIDFSGSFLLKLVSPIFDCLKNGINPAFFIISGFGFRVMSNKKCLTKTISELLKPCLCVMMAYAVCFPLFHYAAFRWWPGAIHESTRFVLAFLLGLPKSGKVFLGYELYECSVVWFLYSLFVSHNVLNWILNVKDEKKQRVLVLLSFISGYLLAKVDFNYYCIPQGLIGVGYCYAGFCVKKTKLYNSKKLPIICVVLAVLSGIQGVWGEFGLPNGIFKYGLIECVLAGCSGLLWLFGGIVIGNAEWRILDLVKTVGVYTYWIICFHSVEMSCIPWYLWSDYMKDQQLLGLCIEMAIAALIIIVGCMLLKKIVKYRYRRRRLING